MACEVNSVPLSLTIIPGLPLRSMRVVSYPVTGNRCVRDGRQALVGDVIHHVEDPEPPAIGHLVVDEVERPPGIRLRFRRTVMGLVIQ
jgi:hypothetical protein